MNDTEEKWTPGEAFTKIAKDQFFKYNLLGPLVIAVILALRVPREQGWIQWAVLSFLVYSVTSLGITLTHFGLLIWRSRQSVRIT